MRGLLILAFLLVTCFEVKGSMEKLICECTDDIYCTLEEYQGFKEIVMKASPKVVYQDLKTNAVDGERIMLIGCGLSEASYQWYKGCLTEPGPQENTEEFYQNFIKHYCKLPVQERVDRCKVMVKRAYDVWTEDCADDKSEPCKMTNDAFAAYNVMLEKYNDRGYCDGLTDLKSMSMDPRKSPSYG